MVQLAATSFAPEDKLSLHHKLLSLIGYSWEILPLDPETFEFRAIKEVN